MENLLELKFRYLSLAIWPEVAKIMVVKTSWFTIFLYNASSKIWAGTNFYIT
jgi:hypothetical protein